MENYIRSEYFKFDEATKSIKLDDQFIFAFRHSDGFTERLLNFELFVDKDYNFVLHLRSFDKSALNDQHCFKLIFESSLPHKIKHPLSILVNDSFNNIEDLYKSEILATDVSSKHIFYNLNGETKSTYIRGGLCDYLSEFEGKNEKRLFKLNDDIMDWIENFHNLITL